MEEIKYKILRQELYEDFFGTNGSHQYRFWQTIDIYPFLEDIDEDIEEEELIDKIYDEAIERLQESVDRYQYIVSTITNINYFDLLYDYEEECGEGEEILDLTNRERTKTCLAEWAYDEIFQEGLTDYIEEIWGLTNEDASKIQKCFRNYKQRQENQARKSLEEHLPVELVKLSLEY